MQEDLDDFYEAEHPIDRAVLELKKNFRKWKKLHTKKIKFGSEEITYFFGVGEYGWKKLLGYSIIAGISFGVIGGGIKIINYSLNKIEAIRKKSLVEKIEHLESKNKNLENIITLQKKLMAKQEKTIETLINKNYFPIIYNELPDAAINGIVHNISKKTVKYKEDKNIKEFRFFVYTIIERGSKFTNVVSDIDLNLKPYDEIKCKGKKLPIGIFDTEAYIYKTTKGEPITKLKIAATYLIRTGDLIKK